MSERPEESAAARVARITALQAIVVAIITAVSGIAGALIQSKATSGTIVHLKGQVKGLQTELQGPGASAAEREALYRLTADHIESDLRLIAGKRSLIPPEEVSDTELKYRMLRRAIFLNMGILRANRTILEGTLQTVKKRGYAWIDEQQARVVAEFPELEAIRLRWLEDVAIPRLQHVIDAEANNVSQSLPNASVLLPREVWILNRTSDNDQPTVLVTSLADLKDEVDLLKRTL
ncbi:hypothetical protein WL03_10955 [Burkholderia ubonensis]|nr:hypothetical protein WL03_10955 [Burkholderia ubonensis]